MNLVIAQTEFGERWVPIQEAALMFRSGQATKVINERCTHIKIAGIAQYITNTQHVDFIGTGALIGFNEGRVRTTTPEIAAKLFEQGLLNFALKVQE